MIVVHAGHRVDQEGRGSGRFPTTRVGSVYRRCYLFLMDRQPKAVVTAAANGADLIILRAAEDLFIPFHIVLPIPIDEFREQSVDDRGPDWGEAFTRAISRAASVHTTSELADFDDWYLRGNNLILDTAASIAQGCENAANGDPCVEAFAVMSSDPTETGATGDFVSKAVDRNWPVHTIDPLLD